MKKMYSVEIWNRGSTDSRYVTPKGLLKDLPCIDENYLWGSKEEAHSEGMREAATWYDPWGVQMGIVEHEVE